MTPFTYTQLSTLRDFRRRGDSMGALCGLMFMHTRDEVVEAIDALVRHTSITEALERVNRVLTLQTQGVALINGRRTDSFPRAAGASLWGLR